MPFAKFFGGTENEAANIEAVVSTHSTTADSSFNFKRKIRNVMFILVAVLILWKNLDLYFEILSTFFSMVMTTGIVVILTVALVWFKLLLRIPNWPMRLLDEHIHQQAIIDTTANTGGSGERNLDYQNDHKDKDDLHDLDGQEHQEDLGDLSDLEDLDSQDDESDECDQGYLTDVDDQDDMEDFDNLFRHHGFLLAIAESDDNGLFVEQNVELHF